MRLDGEHLIGLSSRKGGGWDREQWPQQRQDLYLLRTDIEQPLSVDIRVWPAPEAGDAGCPIAITLVEDPHSSDLRGLHGEWDFPLEWPAGSHSFLGYDVADAGLTSGLMNCGYTDDATQLREHWARHLNRCHLFSDRARALHFLRITSERVPEHAPFFVYGLYLLNPLPCPAAAAL